MARLDQRQARLTARCEILDPARFPSALREALLLRRFEIEQDELFGGEGSLRAVRRSRIPRDLAQIFALFYLPLGRDYRMFVQVRRGLGENDDRWFAEFRARPRGTEVDGKSDERPSLDRIFTAMVLDLARLPIRYVTRDLAKRGVLRRRLARR